MHPFATPREAADGESVFERCEGAKERGPDTKPREGRRRGRGAIRERDGAVLCDGTFKPKVFFSECLNLAPNERWQRGLGMQVERDPEGSNVLR